MKIVVLGAGVTGSTSAYFLARDGHQVTVIDRQPAAGLETSFANGGQVSASHATPWATPETPFKALKWMGREDAPLIFRWLRWDPALWRWGLKFLANCTPAMTRHNTENTVRLALYSRQCLGALRDEESLSYDQLTRGIIHIFRDAKAYDAQCQSAQVMAEAGLPQIILPRDQLVQMEPALAHAAPSLAGGLFSADDESGDAHAFTQAIAGRAAENGVAFLYSHRIDHVHSDKGRISGVHCHSLNDGVDKVITADAYVLCLGSWSPKMARSLGLTLTLYPAKGYSMTLPLAPGETQAPTVSITDDEHKMVYSRLGDRLRGAGTAELAGWDDTLRQQRADHVLNRARDLFPNAGDYSKASQWCGLRPKTPDSLPYLCTTPLGNLFLNTGHGTLGWTMSVGSARVLSDLVAGRSPDIDPSAYRLR